MQACIQCTQHDANQCAVHVVTSCTIEDLLATRAVRQSVPPSIASQSCLRANVLPTHPPSDLIHPLQVTLSLKNKTSLGSPKEFSRPHQPQRTLREDRISCHNLVKDTITAEMATPVSCKHVDDTFGPYAGDCRGGFDFTLLFQDSILSLLPLGVLLIVVPFRVSYLVRRSIKVDPSSWLASKLVGRPTRCCISLYTTR